MPEIICTDPDSSEDDVVGNYQVSEIPSWQGSHRIEWLIPNVKSNNRQHFNSKKVMLNNLSFGFVSWFEDDFSLCIDLKSMKAFLFLGLIEWPQKFCLFIESIDKSTRKRRSLLAKKECSISKASAEKDDFWEICHVQTSVVKSEIISNEIHLRGTITQVAMSDTFAMSDYFHK